MDNVPVTGLDELDQHLNDLVEDSSIPLNAKLFDEVELQLTGKLVVLDWKRLERAAN